MGKPTGFLEYNRCTNTAVTPEERIKNFNEFHSPLDEEARCEQGARCFTDADFLSHRQMLRTHYIRPAQSVFCL